jgi:hypothetical protein
VGERAVHEVAVGPAAAGRWASTAAPALTFALASVPGASPPTAVGIELEAADGAIVRWRIDGPGPLVHPLPAHLVKARWLYGRNGFPGPIEPEEVVLQTFTVPVASFEGDAVDPADVVAVRFTFGGEGAGAVYLDMVAATGE